MKRSIPSMLIIGLLAVLLASCGQSTTGQQTSGTPTASSHTHLSRIAWQGFLDADQTTAAIFSANTDGSDVRQLTQPNTGGEEANPAWSPDGSKIIFTLNSANAPGDLFLMNADRKGLKQLAHCTQPCLGMGVAAWSPDGSTIAYSEGDGPPRSNGDPSVAVLWLMHSDGSHRVQLTHPLLPTSFADDGPAWSPDGTRILFQSFGAFPPGSTPQLYTIFPDGTHLVQLTSKECNSWPAWSPDGTKIIFAHRSTTGVDQNAHLYEMNADGSSLVQVTRNDFWQLQPTWGTAP